MCVPASILAWIRFGLKKRTPDTLQNPRTIPGSRSPASDFPDKSQYSLSTKTQLSRNSGAGMPRRGWDPSSRLADSSSIAWTPCSKLDYPPV